MTDSFDSERLVELVGRLSDEIATEKQIRELDRLLESSADARRLYHVSIAMFENLEAGASEETYRSERQAAFGEVSEPGLSGPKPAEIESLPLARSRFAGLSFSQLALAAALLISAGIGYWTAGSGDWASANRKSGAEESDGVAGLPDHLPSAEIVGLVDVVWKPASNGLAVGDALTARRLRFESGVVELVFPKGARVAIEGPADFQITGEDRAYLWSGQLVALVPAGAEGFRVDTPQTDIIDLGTEFGLRVDSNGSQVHVFQGKVQYVDPNKSTPGGEVTAGLAVAFDGSGQKRHVALEEFTFNVPRQLLWNNKPISTQFNRGNSTEWPGGVPGKKGAGWTGGWEFVCTGGEIDWSQTRVIDESPLGPNLGQYLSVTAASEPSKDDSQGLSLGLSRGFISNGKLDGRSQYLAQLLLRIDSDLSGVNRLEIADYADSESASNHHWELAAERPSDGAGPLRWHGFPITPEQPEDALNVVAGKVYRLVVDVQPKRRRYRISLSDGEQTLVNKWTVTSEASNQTTLSGRPQRRPERRPERRLEFRFDATAEISVSLDAIRIQNYNKLKIPKPVN